MFGTSYIRGHKFCYYRDSARLKGLDCDQQYVRAQEAEDDLAAFLADVRPSENWKRTVLQMIDEQMGAGQDCEQTAKRLGQQLQRLKDLYEMGDVARAGYIERRDKLHEELAALKPPRLPDLERVAAQLNNFGTIWAEATPVDRKALIHAMVTAVYLDSENGPVVYIEPRAEYAVLFGVSQRAGSTLVDSGPISSLHCRAHSPM